MLIGGPFRPLRPHRQFFLSRGEQAITNGTIANKAQNRIMNNETRSSIPPIVPAHEKATPVSMAGALVLLAPSFVRSD